MTVRIFIIIKGIPAAAIGSKLSPTPPHIPPQNIHILPALLRVYMVVEQKSIEGIVNFSYEVND